MCRSHGTYYVPRASYYVHVYLYEVRGTQYKYYIRTRETLISTCDMCTCTRCICKFVHSCLFIFFPNLELPSWRVKGKINIYLLPVNHDSTNNQAYLWALIATIRRDTKEIFSRKVRSCPLNDCYSPMIPMRMQPSPLLEWLGPGTACAHRNDANYCKSYTMGAGVPVGVHTRFWVFLHWYTC